MNTLIKVIKNILLFISSIAVSYMLISIPFHLNDTLTSRQMIFVLVAEVIIYSSILTFFFLFKESKREKEKKEDIRRQHREQRNAEFENEMKSLKINYNNYAA